MGMISGQRTAELLHHCTGRRSWRDAMLSRSLPGCSSCELLANGHPGWSVPSDARSAAAEVVLRATNIGPMELEPGESIPPTGRRIAVSAAWFFGFDKAGLVIAERDYFDTAELLSQLGLND
jgi:hypothetical protein